MTFKQRQSKLKKTAPLLKKHYPMGRAKATPNMMSLIQLLVLATITEDPYVPSAMQTVRRMERDYVDWNEVRVSSSHELGELLKAYHLDPERANDLKSMLQMIFGRENKLSTDLSSSDSFDVIKSYLLGYENCPRRVVDTVLMLLGEHRDIPAGDQVMRFTERMGLIETGAGANSLQLLFKKTLPTQDLRPAHFAICRHCRELCREKAPLCTKCFLLPHCDYGTRHAPKKRAATATE